MGELKTHEAIAEKFQDLRREVQQIAGRLNDLNTEHGEHEAVIKALSDLDPDRKCFRLVGEVLVERTVSEVLPAVRGNHEQIGMVIGKLQEQMKVKQKHLIDFQEKYKIRIRTAADVTEEQLQTIAEPGSSKAQGVLVSQQS